MARVHPRRVDKPWGHEVVFAEGGPYAGKLLVIHDGEALSRQYHEVKVETIYVQSGRLILEIGQPPVEHVLLPGEAWHVEPGTIHRFRADGDTALFEVSTTELDDVVRLEDRYGREGTSEP